MWTWMMYDTNVNKTIDRKIQPAYGEYGETTTNNTTKDTL